jgi:hypothetical protein
VYSLPFVAAIWAAVGITIGWIWATHRDYRVAAGPAWFLSHAEKPVEDHWVGTAKVPVWNTVSERAVAPYAGVVGSTVIRTRIKRHAVTGPSCYEPRTHRMLELMHA